MVFLSLPLECWDYWCVPPCLPGSQASMLPTEPSLPAWSPFEPPFHGLAQILRVPHSVLCYGVGG